jgi:hypothetical protein
VGLGLRLKEAMLEAKAGIESKEKPLKTRGFVVSGVRQATGSASNQARRA